MTEKLNKIKAALNQVIEDGTKVDTGNVTEAISDLENFPMTKALLQSTRVGKVLNEVRKLTSGTLSSRIKCIIRSWQILLHNSAKADTVVIPCKSQNGISQSCHQSPATNIFPIDSTGCSKSKLRRINGSTSSLPALEALMQDGNHTVGSPSSQTSSVISNLAERNNHIQKKNGDGSQLSVKKRFRLSNQHSASEANISFDADVRSPPSKCPRLQSANPPVTSQAGNGRDSPAAFKSESGKSAAASGVVASESNYGNNSAIPKLRIRLGGNGKSATTSVVTNSIKVTDYVGNSVLSPVLSNSTKNFQHFPKDADPSGDTLSAVSGSTNRSSRQQPVSNPSALPRVKSTAELLIQYGTDIKSKKKTNILEIEREPDFVPSALPESARPRRLRTNTASSNRNKVQPGANSAVPGSSQDLSVIDSAASFKRGKTSILEKFLASAVKYSDNDESDKDNATPNEPATYTVTNFVVNSAATAAPVTSPTMSVPLYQVSPASTSKPVLSSHKTKVESSNVDVDTKVEDCETLNESATEDTEVHRKHHKHKRKKKEHKEHKSKHKVHTNHPVTNLMDRRPVPLPPLPNVDPAKYPYPIPRATEVSEKNIDRLLNDTWEGMNCGIHGDTGETVPYTEMYTLGLHNAAKEPQDSVLHMLPWVDLNGWRRPYFPENSLKYLEEFQLAKPR